MDEEEKTEVTINDFLADKDERDPNLSTREEMVHCIKYMKHLLLERENKYGQEIVVLKEQINDLKGKLGEYLAKEGAFTFAQPKHAVIGPVLNKENAGGSISALQTGSSRDTDLRSMAQNDTLEMKKKKIGFSRQTLAHNKLKQQQPPQLNNGPFIGDYSS